MWFLNPALAIFGAAAVSIPIIIHLLNKRKFERVVWAAMRFLRVSVEQNQRRVQIEDILLLILRCLLLLLLGLALARPTIKSFGGGGWFGQAKVTAVLLLDNSYSMTARDGNKSRFDEAKQAAVQAIESLPTGSSVAVLFASDYVPTGPIPEPTFDLELAKNTIKEAKPSDRATDLYPAVRRALDALKDKRAGQREIYLITDAQALGWRKFNDIRNSLEEVRKDIHPNVVLVGAAQTRNVGISGLRLVSGPSVAGHPLHFEVQVTNYGLEDEKDVRVKLRVDGDPPSDEGTIDTLPKGASRSVPLWAKLKTEGGHSVTATIEADRLPADDVRTLAVRALPQVKVLVVENDPSRGRESDSFYLRGALLPVPRVDVESHYNKVTTIAATELDTTKLDQYDAVFLCNVPDFSEQTANAFADYLKRGGGLVIFPGEAVNKTAYNSLLLEKHQFLPAALGDSVGDAAKDDQFFSLQDKNFDHPIATLWNDAQAGTLNVHFFRKVDLKPTVDEKAAPEKTMAADGTEIGRPRTVLRYQDGSPAMMERTWGAGRVILFSSTANTAWNDLGARPHVFIPLLSRTLGSIVSRQDEGLNVKVGERFNWRAEGRMVGREALVYKPGTDTMNAAVADRREIGRAGNLPLLTFDETSTAGAYTVKVGGDEPVNFVFAAQPDADESRLDELANQQVDDLGKVADVTKWSGGTSLTDTLTKKRVGTEFWKYLALIALALATAETILAHRFSKAK
ncbi:MAG TPA: VWA domain-containing protein [Tepidisphaeraceae bacterium]|nr:VWA domain-containing protein [Tepidisphaeraceae bacterium]